MIEVADLKVQSWSIDWLDVNWSVKEHLDDEQNYQIRVERSESAHGPFDAVSSEFDASLYAFRDGSVRLNDKWRKYYYRIRLRDIRDDSVTYSDVTSLGPKPPLQALEVIRRFYMINREKNAREVLVYPKRTWGQRCPTCWDATQGRSIKSNCPTCFGTTFSQAYLDPVVARIQIDPSPKSEQYSAMPGKTQSTMTSARCIPHPEIKPSDMLVEAENIRWTVVNVSSVRLLQYPVRQEMMLARIDPSDPEMKVPVNWTVDEPSPVKEFSNPHNTEAVI